MSHRERSSASSSPGLEPSTLREAARRLECLVQEFEVGQPIGPAAPARMGPSGCPAASVVPDAIAARFEELEEECSHYGRSHDDGMAPPPLPLEHDEDDGGLEGGEYERLDLEDDSSGAAQDAVVAPPAPGIPGGEDLALMLDEELLKTIVLAGPSRAEAADASLDWCVEGLSASREAAFEPAEGPFETMSETSPGPIVPPGDPAAGHGTFDNEWVFDLPADPTADAPASPGGSLASGSEPAASEPAASGPAAAAVVPPASEVEPPPFLVEPPILAGASQRHARGSQGGARKFLAALGLNSARR